MKFEAVIFDLDGTLIDSMGIWTEVDVEFLARRNIEVPADLFDDDTLCTSFPELAVHFKKRFQLPESVEEIIAEWTEQVIEHYSHSIPMKEGAEDVLHFLQEHHIPMAIGTSNSLFLTNTVLERHQLHSFFQCILTPADVDKSKPHPEIYLQTASRLHVAPEKCLVIEDSLAGVTAGKRAGMTVIAIADESAKKEEAQIKTIADIYIYEFNELLEILSTGIKDTK